MFQADSTFDTKLGGAATDEMGSMFTGADVCKAPFYINGIVTADAVMSAAV